MYELVRYHAHAQGDMNLHILHRVEGTFSFGAAHMSPAMSGCVFGTYTSSKAPDQSR